MSLAVALMQTLLGPETSAETARSALNRALLTDVDPLRWCAIHAGRSDAELMAGAAAWIGLAYFDVVPRVARPGIAPGRLEALGQVRLYRLRLLDREVAFAAPDFFGLLRLARALAKRPDLASDLCLVPEPALREFLVQQASPALIDSARQTMARHWPRAAAQLELTGPARRGFALMMLLVTLLTIGAPLAGQNLIAPLWFVIVMLPTALRLFALANAPPAVPAGNRWRDDNTLPVYSVLVPLRDEAEMVDQLCTNLGRLDYPADKLDVTFVVESRSPATIEALRPYLRDPRFSLVVVPDAPPRTKPKALNFALPFCRGEFVVVFDAEDRPEPDQLKRMVAHFRRHPDIECIQARLVIDNGNQGILPALFAGEYAGLFSVILPALAWWGIVMPLGGTSNHLRLETLRRLGGWDAFNVTEDADLGVRLARRRLRCATSSSRTYEAAPVRFLPWLGQRTRWMKGWMQTYAVHHRHPEGLLADLGWMRLATLQVVLLGMLLAPLLHAGFVIMVPALYLAGQLAWPQEPVWLVACLAVLVLGNAATLATNLVGLKRTGQLHLAPWQILVPFYWLMIAGAAILAIREFSVRPFHWFKSPHQASQAPIPTSEAAPERGPTFLRLVPPAQPTGKSFQRLGRKPI